MNTETKIIFLIIFLGFFGLAKSSQAATNVYYSVGQNTDDHSSGGNVSITSGAATFTVAQAATNLGVGDALTANSHIYYLVSKTDTTHWSVVNAQGSSNVNESLTAVTSITHAFASLHDAVANASDSSHLNTANLVMGNYILNIPCYYDTGPDTAQVTIENYITGASNYIKIYTPYNTSTEVNQSQRHQGKWDNNKYRLEYSASGDWHYAIEITNVSYVRFEGLQIYNNDNGHDQTGVLKSWTDSITEGKLIIQDNIARGAGDTGGPSGFGFTAGATVQTAVFANNIVYDFNSYGIDAGSDGSYLYNNTAYNCSTGFHISGVVAKNNAAFNNSGGDFFGGTWTDPSSTNNASSDSTASEGLLQNGITGLSAADNFSDVTNHDFHLKSGAGLINSGVSLSGDSVFPFSTDIEGQSRPDPVGGIWDIGADEAATAVYYSVGQDGATDFKTGSPTVTLSSDTATFSVAQTGNIGVGDRVTYNGSTIAYISGKISPTQWTLETANGGTPPDISGQTVNSIKRTFTSLEGAIEGADGILGTSDLVAGNYILNIPCYYDTGPDTTAVDVTGYTTGVSNYIKIYTPNNTSYEVNTSQRHQGKWNNNKYILQTADDSGTLVVRLPHVKMEGLQIISTSYVRTYAYGIDIGNDSTVTDVTVEGCIIKKGSGSSDHSGGITVNSGITNPIYVYNNIVYGFNGTNQNCIGMDGDHGTRYASRAYNNTVYDCTMGIGGESVTLKNNVAQNCTDGFSVWGDSSNGDDYNISDVTGDTANYSPSYHPGLVTAVSFIKTTSGSEDLHLTATDLGAASHGVDLSADANLAFNTDIDGEPRTLGGWDIGADQAHKAESNKLSGDPSGDTETINMSLTDKMKNGLIGMWSFDGADISGTTAYDRSVSGTNGSINGAVPVIGKNGQALSFSNSSDYILFSDTSTWTWTPVTQDRTLSFWFYPTANPSDVTHPFQFLYSIDSPANHYQFSYFNNSGTTGLACVIQNNDLSSVVGAFSTSWTPTLNNWYHIVFVASSAGNNKIYINGVSQSVSESTWNNTNTQIDPSNTIVASTSGAGRVDEMRLYNRALSDAEVQDLYNLGNATIKK